MQVPWRIRRLRTRIVLFFALLLAGVQLATYAIVRDANTRTQSEKIAAELATGQKIFERSVEQERSRLIQAARVLAADYAFREAVAINDEATLRSALDNHAGRVDAQLALVVGADRKQRLAVTSAISNEQIPLDDLLADAAAHGAGAGAAVVGGRAYELVIVPVLAPLPIAWIALGFPIDERAISELRELSGLDVTLAQFDRDAPRLLTSTLPAPHRDDLRRALASLTVEVPQRLRLGDDDQQIKVVTLQAAGEGRRLVAILSRSLTAALAPFESLQLTLLLVATAALAISLAGSVLIGLGITRPLGALTRSARRLRDGDYSAPIDVSRGDELGELAQSLHAMRDGIAEREAEILRLAYEDTLTALPNRSCFSAAFRKWVDARAAHGIPGAVLVVALDRFKSINEVLGHAKGDEVLRAVARRLQAVAGPDEMVARLGADQFALLLSGAGPDAAQRCVKQIAESLASPLQVDGQSLDLHASVGIALYPEHGDDAAHVLRNADIAVQAAKAARSGLAFYDPKHDTAREEHLSLLGELKRAVERDELALHYQPKRALDDGRIVGAEALVRWWHPQRGFMAPGLFVPFAEQTGYIRHLTHWALETALRQIAVWLADGIDLVISVNLSARDLEMPDLPERVAEALARHGVPARNLCLEITESGLMEDPEGALAITRKLAALGIALSIDDFGTGYSSLGYLARLPVREVKIDRSFVVRMKNDPAVLTVVRATVDLGHGLGLKVTAEGVESAEDERLLRDIGCDLIQGWLIAKAMPAGEFVSWLRVHDAADPALLPQPLRVSA